MGHVNIVTPRMTTLSSILPETTSRLLGEPEQLSAQVSRKERHGMESRNCGVWNRLEIRIGRGEELGKWGQRKSLWVSAHIWPLYNSQGNTTSQYVCVCSLPSVCVCLCQWCKVESSQWRPCISMPTLIASTHTCAQATECTSWSRGRSAEDTHSHATSWQPSLNLAPPFQK